jgi:hypothetical protein
MERRQTKWNESLRRSRFEKSCRPVLFNVADSLRRFPVRLALFTVPPVSSRVTLRGHLLCKRTTTFVYNKRGGHKLTSPCVSHNCLKDVFDSHGSTPRYVKVPFANLGVYVVIVRWKLNPTVLANWSCKFSVLLGRNCHKKEVVRWNMAGPSTLVFRSRMETPPMDLITRYVYPSSHPIAVVMSIAILVEDKVLRAVLDPRHGHVGIGDIEIHI